MNRQPDRYAAEGIEAQFEPGSRGRVLRNRQGITSAREMARRESESLLVTTQRVIDETQLEQRFTADDIRRMHRLWLGDIYVWAGEFRQVNMGKGNFMFAAATQVPRLMQEFERGPLHEYTPCRFGTTDEQAQALAVVHAELILNSPVSRGKWALRASAGDADGFAGRVAGVELRRHTRREKAAVHRGGACRFGP